MRDAQFYAVKHKKAKRWFVYKWTVRELESLHEDYEYRGPYSGVFKAMVGVKNE